VQGLVFWPTPYTYINSNHKLFLRDATERDVVFETLVFSSFSEYQMMGQVQKPCNSECYHLQNPVCNFLRALKKPVCIWVYRALTVMETS
jgi:hypothetical protein